MNDKPCVVTVNGTQYFVSCSGLEYLVVFDNALINTSSSTIYLYSSFPNYGDNYSGYPRITAPANQKARYTASYNSTTTQLTVNSYNVTHRYISNEVLLFIVLIGFVGLNLFKKR